ncbi:hypothetical protein GCM10020367_06230 [Streptomyces sannanensis]|uniref:Uncharacterized protein n=1 Tax=Streptomyces sannanensis TaxID=285536 RepID=A0ABP6S587_9ACTN
MLITGLLEHHVPISEAMRAEIAVVAEAWGMWTALAPGIGRCPGSDDGDTSLKLIEQADGVPLRRRLPAEAGQCATSAGR